MNRRRLLVTAAVAPVALAFPLPSRAARAGGGIVALVTADLEAHIVAVELASGRVVERVPTASGPRSIESNAFGHVVVAHTASGRVSLLDAATLTVTSVVAGLGEPRYTAMHPSEQLAYVTDSKRQEVVTLDLADGVVVHRTPVPGPARHVSLSSDGRVLWTALGSRAAELAVLDAADPRRPRFVRTLAPPFLAHDVVFAPGGEHVWVTSGNRRSLLVYERDGAAGVLVPAAAPPQHVAFSSSRAYVASGNDGTLRVHRHDGAVVRSVPVPHGSFNLTFESAENPLAQATVVTPSLDRGTICLLEPGGRVRFVRRVARSAHDACVVEAG